MRLRRFGLTSCLLLMALALAGCWNRREVETLGFVVAVGVNRGPDGGVELTAQVPIPSLLAGEAGGGGGRSSQPAFWVVKSSGRTTFEAARRFLEESPRRLQWSHNQVVIFSETYARTGVREALDILTRDSEPRRTAWVMVARESSIDDVLSAAWPIERLTGVALDRLMTLQSGGLGGAPTVDINTFVRALAAPGLEPVAAAIELTGPDTPPKQRDPLEPTKSHLATRGSAVFQGDRLVGWLDPIETRGLAFLQNKVKTTVLPLDCKVPVGEKASVELLRAHTTMKPQVTADGRISFTIKIQAEGALDEFPCREPINVTTFRSMERKAAQAIEGEVMRALRRLQYDYHADAMGFGLAVYRTYPRLWKRLQADWNKRLPDIPAQVQVRMALRRSALTERPLQVQ